MSERNSRFCRVELKRIDKSSTCTCIPHPHPHRTQALPGPLFNLAAYLGAVAGGVPGIFICWIGLFGPGVMLIFGVLPIWGW